MKSRILSGVFILCFGLLMQCKKDQPPQNSSSGSITSSKRLLICNEGNFGLGNGSISVYDPVSGNVVTDAYRTANNNQYIGDVLESYSRFEGKYYWAVNNSGKVVITDLNFVRLSSVSGFISPRYIEVVGNNKAYVSNLQLNLQLPNYIQIIDLNQNAITGTIRIDGWTEQMAQSYGKVFITNVYKKYLYVVDASSDAVVDSIFLNAGSNCIIKDQNEKIWVACDTSAGNSSRLVRINPVSHQIELDLSLHSTQSSISRMEINGSGSTIYYLMNDLYKFGITQTAVPTASFILQSGRTFYGLGIDPYDETIYVSDAINFNQSGVVYRYKSDGTAVANFHAGIIPGNMTVE